MGASGVASVVEAPWPGSAGLRILVPGYPQWARRETGRAAVLFGWYASALAVGLFAWGTWVGYGFLAFALASHLVSAVDAIRHGAFPGFGRWVPVASASAGVGLFYAPALVGAWTLAWPADRAGAPGEGFLVNRWAYREAPPEAGDWVWFDDRAAGRGVGRLWARSGQEVEWVGGRMRIGGERVDWRPPALWQPVRDMILKVPEGYVLVEPLGDAAEGGPGWILVEVAQIHGRAWAQHSPVWGRRLLR